MLGDFASTSQGENSVSPSTLNLNLAGVNPSVKTILTHFLKEAVEDEPWNFKINGNQYNAKSFVQRMRTELSRYRNILIQRNRIPKKFKMLIHNIIEYSDRTVEIQLIKTYDSNTIDVELMTVMESLCIEKGEK